MDNIKESTPLRIFRRISSYIAGFKCEIRKFRIGLVADVKFGKGVFVASGVVMRTYEGGQIVISDHTHIWQNAVLDARGGKIKIARGALVNCGCFIAASESVAIGENALIAEYVTIRDSEHNHIVNGLPFSEQGMSSAPISIDNNVWLGAKSTVTKGVRIGANTIVGANSVVTRNLAPNGKYVGAPARALTTNPSSQ